MFFVRCKNSRFEFSLALGLCLTFTYSVIRNHHHTQLLRFRSNQIPLLIPLTQTTNMDPRHRSASYSQETPGGFTLDQSLGVRPTANANAAFIEHAFVDGQPTSLRQHEAALGLTQVRRHSASVAAAPLHGSSFKSSEIGTTKLARSASWAPESPTRKYSVTHCGKSHEKKNAEFGWFKRMRESRFFTSRIIKRNKMEFCKRMLMCISRVQASETQLAHSFMSSILRSTSH